MQKLSEQERQRLEKLHKEAMEQKKRHRKVNHPGSARQMKEVWEEVDHLESQQFNPQSFFKLHDINGDGLLDEAEIEAIMLKEVRRSKSDPFSVSLPRSSRPRRSTVKRLKQIRLNDKKKWIACDNT